MCTGCEHFLISGVDLMSVASDNSRVLPYPDQEIRQCMAETGGTMDEATQMLELMHQMRHSLNSLEERSQGMSSRLADVDRTSASNAAGMATVITQLDQWRTEQRARDAAEQEWKRQTSVLVERVQGLTQRVADVEAEAKEQRKEQHESAKKLTALAVTISTGIGVTAGGVQWLVGG